VNLGTILLAVFLPGLAPHGNAAAVRVPFVTDEADAVLFMLRKREARAALTPADWRRLFSSEGYRRLEKRETGMGRPFEKRDFEHFVESGALLARRRALAGALRNWKSADAPAAARRALAYLPPGASIHATIFPVIKPKENSFVADLETDPAIFLAVDPAVARAKLENTLAHELHHVGYAQSCDARAEPGPERIGAVVAARKWLSAFGEGIAMLAAAGGPDVHPHGTSPPAERARWDRDVARVDEDFARLISFFDDVSSGRLAETEANARGMSYFGIQGPWYTVGYTMAVTVERAFGRPYLVERLCDPAAFLEAYNRAAGNRNRTRGTSLPLWPTPLLEKLRSLSSQLPRTGSPQNRRTQSRSREGLIGLDRKSETPGAFGMKGSPESRTMGTLDDAAARECSDRNCHPSMTGIFRSSRINWGDSICASLSSASRPLWAVSTP
jgi:hypothetical protein